MSKRIFEIEFPDDCGPFWMNKDNLLLCLKAYCKNVQFHVKDVTGLMQELQEFYFNEIGEYCESEGCWNEDISEKIL